MRLPVLFPVVLLTTLPLPSQDHHGQLRILVVDENGRPVPAAKVVVSGLQGGASRTMLTDDQGEALLRLLPLGRCRIVITKDGHIGSALDCPVSRGTACHTIRLRSVSTASCTVEVVASNARIDKSECITSSASLAPGVTRAGQRMPAVQKPSAPPNTEAYRTQDENPFQLVRQHPLSTFGVDVDSASYSNIRRFLNEGTRPPKDAVKLEELVNYFPYQHPAPPADQPFAVTHELSVCPWAPQHQLLRISLQARRIPQDQLPPRNLVFLIDVSGSMSDENKLPLIQQGLTRLTQQLRPEDRVAMVVYAGSSGLVLESTSGQEKGKILDALEHLSSGGSTHGAAGIEQAYAVAQASFKPGADNRVLLCTDGDFNVGISDEGSLVRLIEAKRQGGVFLTCLGFGMGNYKDSTLEMLANRGNGNHAYVDSLKEMEKVFGAGGQGLVTVAKDVKLQVEFNPARVQSYRLLGYENRLLNPEDFNNDKKDAGEINAGHCVTALYEIVPPGAAPQAAQVDALRYQKPAQQVAHVGELATIKVRHKKPDGFFSRKTSFVVPGDVLALESLSTDTRWAAAVATFGLCLKGSEHKGAGSYALARTLAQGCLEDLDPLRGEFLELIGKAESLQVP